MLAISPGSKLKYDMKTYLKYAEKLVEKCSELTDVAINSKEKTGGDVDEEVKSEETGSAKEDSFGVTPFILGECLWTETMITKLGDVEPEETNMVNQAKPKRGKKRKIDSESKGSKKRRVDR